MANNEAAVLAERLRAAAAAAGAYLVEGHVRTGSASTIPEVYLETEAALALISVAIIATPSTRMTTLAVRVAST